MLIVIDTARNLIRFELEPQERAGETIAAPADLDIGERGRLLSLEILLPGQASRAIVIDDHPVQYARTAHVEVQCRFDANGALVQVTLPRRGPGYELSYPSGNECWIDASGAQHCAITRSI